MLREYRVFLRQFFQQYHTTGSVLPSSRSLAKAPLPLRAKNPVIRIIERERIELAREILEVGPGTGAQSTAGPLVTQMKSADRIDRSSSWNDEFVRPTCKSRLATETGVSQKVADRSTTILHKRLEDVPRRAIPTM